MIKIRNKCEASTWPNASTIYRKSPNAKRGDCTMDICSEGGLKVWRSLLCMIRATPWLILSDYESMRYAFTQDKTFPKDETYSSYVGIAFGDDLISATDREKHRKDKSLLFPFFTKKRVETLIPSFCENTNWTMNKFLGDGNKEHADIDLDEIVLHLTHRHIMSHVWDKKVEDDD